MQPKPKISIVTPNYNYANFIGATIQSAIDQGYENFEHIIVDDGSTDNSIEVIQKYVNRYPNNIKLICQENKGQTIAINVGLRQVTGDVIGWFNSDDTLCQNAFRNILKTFKKYPDADAVIGNIKIIDNDDNLIKNLKYLKFDYASGVFNGFGKIVASNAIFWKKELIDKVGYLDESFEYAMDSEYWSRLLYNRNVVNIDAYLANFRWHPKAKTILRRNKNNEAYTLAFKENEKVFRNSYYKLGISKLIPYKLAKPLRLVYKVKRILFRLLKRHYF